MTIGKYASFALAALLLAGCGSSAREQQAASYCPQPLTVQDAQRLTRFKEGPGRDPRDVMFEASLVSAGTKCQISRNKLEVEVLLRIAVNAGPSVGTGVTRVPFFVRVLDGNGAVVQGSDQLADYKISAASPRGLSQEEMAVTLPFANVSDLGGYRIAVGLKPSQQELDYNRSSGVR
ncbi:hypothetical protein [Reyranella sp.]|uniref:hypothetical protein n=1 Tax=Reyranella sp. TaxID=1929291 RepID=UPI003D0B281E